MFFLFLLSWLCTKQWCAFEGVPVRLGRLLSKILFLPGCIFLIASNWLVITPRYETNDVLSIDLYMTSTCVLVERPPRIVAVVLDAFSASSCFISFFASMVHTSLRNKMSLAIPTWNDIIITRLKLTRSKSVLLCGYLLWRQQNHKTEHAYAVAALAWALSLFSAFHRWK